MLTTRPQPCSYMPGRTARARRNGASTIRASMAAKRSGGNLDRGHVLEAGVVDQHVGGQLQAVEAGLVGQVGGHRDPAELARDPLGAVAVQVDHGHPRPGRGQPAGAGLADAAGPAGDHGGPAVQVDAHRPSIPAAHGRSSCFMTLPRALRGNAST